jgi:hypothetical protein
VRVIAYARARASAQHGDDFGSEKLAVLWQMARFPTGHAPP